MCVTAEFQYDRNDFPFFADLFEIFVLFVRVMNHTRFELLLINFYVLLYPS